MGTLRCSSIKEAQKGNEYFNTFKAISINRVVVAICERFQLQIVIDQQIKFVGELLGKIANALEQFAEDKTPHLYGEVMSMEVEGFDGDFLYNVFDYLVGHESDAKAFLAKSTKYRKIWLQKFSQC
ncbi:hypothetical protein PVK06_042266 [Gossypium arboreum]|uniref:Uncharacterized protein n=1 Tax=Gossypium arboreum TaxID=29729 RepID=A0ABR0MK73_GOSAR|nr:hypothetical protein PVK06_042266 [Gossypium arboreum]